MRKSKVLPAKEGRYRTTVSYCTVLATLSTLFTIAAVQELTLSCGTQVWSSFAVPPTTIAYGIGSRAT